MTEINWQKQAFFAQAAEALKCNTSEVFSVYAKDGDFVVTYTPGVDDAKLADCPAYGAVLRHDVDGILRVIAGPVEIPGFMEKLKANISKLMSAMRDPEDEDDA